MPMRRDCAVTVMDYFARPKSTTVPESKCPELSSLCKCRPESGLGRCDRCEELCRRNRTALGSSIAVWLYSMDILGKCGRTAIEAIVY